MPPPAEEASRTFGAQGLPMPPAAALRVVHACASADTSAVELGSLIGQDPVLAAEVLRAANSAYFGLASAAKSVSRAVTVIGQHALRNLVLCTAVRGAVTARDIPALPIDAFWEAALRRAVCARLLGSAVGIDQEDCFTTGLLQDFGLLVLFYQDRNRAFDWPELATQTPSARLALEAQRFGTTHDIVGRELAQAWRLPAEFLCPMAYHHESPPEKLGPELTALCHVASCADWMAAVFTTEPTEKRATLRHCRERIKMLFGLSAEMVDALLDQAATQIADAAQALDIPLAAQDSYTEIMQQANLQLTEENLSMQALNRQLEQALEERDRMAAELRHELDLAREVQRSLFPRGIAEHCGIAGLNLSARAVSGDFYDFFALNDGRIAFCIADVSGKGMHAALLMAKASSLFRCLGKSIADPGRLLGMVNGEIAETSIRGMFITIVAGISDPSSGRIVLANAGHVPALKLDRNGHFESYPAAGPPLGVAPDLPIPTQVIELHGGSLYLYTDGLLEAPIPGGERLGERGVEQLIRRHHAKSPSERLHAMAAEVQSSDSAAFDDLTLLLIEPAARAS
jgi:serine phosphatase RsbU (regulator of sigma subunit)